MSRTVESSWKLRQEIAGELGSRLPKVLKRAKEHESGALKQLAELRRGVGKGFGGEAAASRAFTQLVSLPPDASPGAIGSGGPLDRIVDDAFLVASLVSLTRVGVRRPEKGRPSSFGSDLCWLRRRPEKEAAAERLFNLIAGADRAGLDYHLRRAFALLASEELQVDAAALVRDLGSWDAEDERVKKQWAYHFWVGVADEDELVNADEEEQK